jgi:hypothetical protein
MTRKMFSVSSEFWTLIYFSMRLRLTQPYHGNIWFLHGKMSLKLASVDSTHFVQVIIDDWFVHVLSDERPRYGRSHSYTNMFKYYQMVSVKYFLIDSYTSTSRPWGSTSMTTISYGACITSSFPRLQSVSIYGRRFRHFLIWSALGVVPRGLCM